MIDKQKVLDIIDEELVGTPIFLVELKVSTGNRISVYIDGDEGVTISDCIDLSRAIEGNFDREVEDYELNVYSAGVEEPLKLKRQYFKNIGRTINIKTLAGEAFEGTLTGADEDTITVQLPVPKKKKAGKEASDYIKQIPFGDIEEAMIVITF